MWLVSNIHKYSKISYLEVYKYVSIVEFFNAQDHNKK